MKKYLANLNYPLLVFMLIYSILGLLMIFSASSVAAVLRYKVPTNYFFLKQLKWLLIAYTAGIFIMYFPTKAYQKLSYLGMGGILIALVLIFSIGKVRGGAQSWFEVGRYNFQPTEFAKIILITFLSSYYYKTSLKKKITLWHILFPLIIAGAMAALIMLQPDFGGAFILFGITAMIFFSLPMAKKHKKTIVKVAIGGLIIGLGSLLVFGKSIFRSYQVSRLLNFANPCERYTDETGYQVCNGYIAIHNGGLTGVGLGKSTQKYLYLPEAHTDFIFPIICEELGLVVGVLIVLGYFVMLFLILNVAKETDNLRNSILAYGVFAYFLLHILINLLGVLGLIPLTGVPLPFLSYGGSYNLCVIISLFIVQRINLENRENKKLERIKNL